MTVKVRSATVFEGSGDNVLGACDSKKRGQRQEKTALRQSKNASQRLLLAACASVVVQIRQKNPLLPNIPT